MEKKGIKKEVKMHFVLPNGCNTPNKVNDQMKMAYQESQEAGLAPQWITAVECLNFQASKNDVFVLQEFEGEIFEKLQSTKSFRVCGPMCLRSCLAENKPIPDNKSPVFTTAMRGVVLTASQVAPTVKADIKKKVNFMGGVYMNNLSEPVTHLVTNAVRSAKYEVAGQKGLPIMKVEWVDALWQESQKRNVTAADPDFLNSYRCPIFYNMFIVCSNISKEEKEEIKNLVTKYGGTYTASMRESQTTLLVLREPRGDKFTYARQWQLPCVLPSYIHKSVKKGYAVPSKGHLVEPKVSCSTPTKEEDTANFTYNSDPSISVINFESNKTHVDETQVTNFTQMGSQMRHPVANSGSQHVEILNKLSVTDAKKAGSFVDGCKVFLSGFTAVEVEKLRRILSLGGATVFAEISDSVSHVILGEFMIEHIKCITSLIQKPHVVSLEWLAASIKKRSPAAEEPFYCLGARTVAPEPPSPLSQKGVQLLKPPSGDSETLKMPPPPEPPVNRKLFSEFLKDHAKSPSKQNTSSMKGADQSTNSMSMSMEDSVLPNLFLGKKFLIVGYDSEPTENMVETIESAGGSVEPPNFKGVADYAIVPLDTPVSNITALEVVTYIWLEDCIYKTEVLEVEYYHQPFSVDREKEPLAECCLSFSNYSGQEKAFLSQLAEALGATCQDVLAKVAKKDLSASTHLVCPKPEGKKFSAATRWGLRVINKDWLLACAASNSKVAEMNYAVTESNLSNVNGQHGHTATTPGRLETRTPVMKEITPQPSGSVNKDCPSTANASNKRVAEDLESICGPPTTPHNDPETSFQTPAIPHRTVSSLKRKISASTPDDQSPFHMPTPDTPYGQAIATPTASTKKRWKRFIDDFPSKPKTPEDSPKNTRRQSTPLSELKRRIWARALETSDENVNANYSIEDMEQNPDSAGGTHEINPSPLNNENTKPRKLTAGRATPSVSDFKASNGSSSSRKEEGATLSSAGGINRPEQGKDPLLNDVEEGATLSSAGGINRPEQGKDPLLNDVENTDTRPPDKRTPDNELVCKMLGQLHQTLKITPNHGAQEQNPLPDWKELANSNKAATPAIDKPVTTTVTDSESQPVLMGWEDPVELAVRAKMMNSSSPSANKPRKFLLSNVAEREFYEEKLRSLGESVCSGLEFEKETTHLVVDKPVRSEKLLCCLAGGRWVLHTSFIDRMMLLGKYVPEEERYEWGSPLSADVVPAPTSGEIEYQLAQAAYRWRKQLSGSLDGAFKGMKAMLFTTPSKCESYKRLIMAGGGMILPSTTSSVPSATHCFIETNKVSNMPIPLTEFVAHKVPCLPPVFLGEMLIKFPAPNTQDSLIPEYKRLLRL